MKTNNKGLSIIEIMLATAIFVFFSGGAVSLVLHSFSSTRLAEEQLVANNYANEGMEAVRSISNQAFGNLANTTGVGVSISGSNIWTFFGTNNTYGKYTRVITVGDVQRDGGGNVVTSGGTVDPNTKKVTSTVTWQFSPGRNRTLSLTSYFTNWRAMIGGPTGGMLVYADSSSAADIINYRKLSSDGTSWSSASAVIDVDAGSTNKAPRSVKVYASKTRDEKVLVSKHYNGTSQTIYAQVYNGSSWGNLVTLATWNSTSRPFAQDFDGGYLNNGTFVVVYSDNSNTPKQRTWNGTTWGSQSSLTGLGSIPIQVELKTRPETNEAMVVFLTSNSSTISQYYSGSSWSGITTHANAVNTLDRRYISFDWSPNDTTKGALAYTSTANDRSLDIKIWTANGSGGGSWSSSVSTANQGNASTRLGDSTVSGGVGINFFMICNQNTALDIMCYKSNMTPAITNPTNQTIETSTTTGNQRVFSAMYNPQSSTNGIIVYSNNSNIPRYKTYTEATSTWSATSSNITTTPYTPNIIKSVEMIPNTNSGDIMVLIADNSLDLYSTVWNSSTNSFYTTPTAKTFTQHGTSGTNSADYYFDFAWDSY